MIRQPIQSQNGMAAVEFAALAGMFMLMVFVIIDFGSILSAQAVVTNISREGGSLASRDLKNGPDLLTLLAASSAELDFPSNPTRFKIFLAKVDAGVDANNPDPTCTVQENGQLVGVDHLTPTASSTCDVPQNLFDLLVFDDAPTVQASPISQLTVVKVFWVQFPLTPMEAFFNAGGNSVLNFAFNDQGGLLGGEPDSILLTSKSIF